VPYVAKLSKARTLIGLIHSFDVPSYRCQNLESGIQYFRNGADSDFSKYSRNYDQKRKI
jgi:hypothetical protein